MDVGGGGGLCSGDAQVVATRESHMSQQQLLQRLYVELDEEREASATAASEALSMILRLQGEKAAVKMEADHYRRVAEERVCHAERSLEVFEDVVRQKDMEIASLEFQVLAYRYKLMSLGCGTDLGATDSRLLEGVFCQRFDLCCWVGKEPGGANVRRINSLPPPCSKDICRKDDDTMEKRFWCLANGDAKPCQEQMKVPRGQAKELPEGNYPLSRPSISSMSELSDKLCPGHQKEPETDTVPAKEAPGIADCTVGIHDVFEVPGDKVSCEGFRVGMRDRSVRALDEVDDNRLGKPDPVTEAHDVWIKDMLVSLNNNKVQGKSREITTCANEDDDDRAVGEIGDSEIRNEVWALSKRVERLEKKRSSGGEGIVREQSKTLKEIKEQLSLIIGEMRHERSKDERQRRHHLQPSLLFLQEAMLHFWL
ncbi:hypothetical protein MLD38_015289 [Melastoma candidum]|uniref:Uncharacterized protein n=1 Tax=Melastoma candidum TaxID=119954 RepID=A0ACB9RJB9_9MYRT|nr:hypothetical protein MLD38_015289 [Melastoma candidum]